MIDIENQMFTIISNALTASFSGIKMSSETILEPSEFPCVCVEEIANKVRKANIDSGAIEHYAEVTYEINVYSNKKTGKKTQCKKIISEVDTLLSRLGFTRTYKSNFSFDNGTKNRLIARYTAVVSENELIYRR